MRTATAASDNKPTEATARAPGDEATVGLDVGRAVGADEVGANVVGANVVGGVGDWLGAVVTGEAEGDAVKL